MGEPRAGDFGFRRAGRGGRTRLLCKKKMKEPMPPLVTLCFRVAFAVAVLSLIVLSLSPAEQLPNANYNDKFMHFFAYAMVAGLGMFAFPKPAGRTVCVILLFVLGATLEVGQAFVPGRACELWDVAANGCGAFAAMGTSRLFSLW